jgi:hypothetical protein
LDQVRCLSVLPGEGLSDGLFKAGPPTQSSLPFPPTQAEGNSTWTKAVVEIDNVRPVVAS